MIPIKKSHITFYRDIPLYIRSEDSDYILYKPAGMTVSEMRIQEDRMPDQLFLRKSDKLAGIQEVQREFNHQLTSSIKSEKPEEVRDLLVSIVGETLQEPKTGSLEGLSDTVNSLLSDYARKQHITQYLLDVAAKDYSTVLHSINVMALTIEYGYYTDMPLHDIHCLGLSALLHDVGKTNIPDDILRAPRLLTNTEFAIMQQHTESGYAILRECRFGERNIPLTALEHHEKLDGSGYPGGKTRISHVAKVISIIDCYEALTNDFRPYRDAMPPLEALRLLKTDVKNGKFDRTYFEHFCYSLATERGFQRTATAGTMHDTILRF